MKLLAVFAFLPFTLSAQTLSESFDVHVLEVEAVVLDRAGNAVRGLARDDFEVTIDGKPAEVTNFYAVHRGAIVETPGTSAPGTTPAQQVPAKLIVVLDDLHLRQGARKRALSALKQYFQTSSSDAAPTMILRWNGTLSTRVKPTTDPGAIIKAIEEMEREPASMTGADLQRRRVMREIDNVILHPIPYTQDSQAAAALLSALGYVKERSDEAENTIGALSQLISLVAGLDGRKTLLFISEGLPQQPGVEVLDYAREVFRRNPIDDFDIDRQAGGAPADYFRYDQSKAFARLSALAQSAGVVFSSLDPGGLRAEEGMGSEYATSLARLNAMLVRENEAAGARVISSETGGRYITNENDLDRAIAILAGDASTYYSLGVRPQNGRAVDVTVRVRGRDDLRVLTPRQRTIKTAEEAIASAIRARLYSREEANPLAARLVVGAVWPRDGRCVASVRIIVPPATRTTLPESAFAVHAIAADDRGIESPVHTSVHPMAAAGVPTVIAVELGFKPRRYFLSLAVVDEDSNESSYMQDEIDATICGR